jgi:hypothetical protein
MTAHWSQIDVDFTVYRTHQHAAMARIRAMLRSCGSAREGVFLPG